MTIEVLDLLDEIRIRADDLGGDRSAPNLYVRWQEDDTPCLWKNTDVVRAVNWAIGELGRRAPILDNGTSAIAQVSVLALTRAYTLSPAIQTVESVRLASTGASLIKSEIERLATAYWQSAQGAPSQYYENTAPHELSLYPLPIATDTLLLSVRRLYADRVDWELIADEIEPCVAFSEIDDTHRETLVVGALSRMFLKRDADTFNAAAAAEYAQEFTRLAGPVVDARTLETRRLSANLTLVMVPSDPSPLGGGYG